jgi:YD repeat-containing protein
VLIYAVEFPNDWAPDGSRYGSRATDAFGTVHMHTFANITGALKLNTENEGGGNVAWTYDAHGNPLTRYGNTVQTSFVYDPTRNLETSRTESSGLLARTISTTWHPTYRIPATITEPSGVAGVNLVTTFSHDASGNLIKKNMTAGAKVREWNYTYNTHGQVLTIDGPRTDVSDVTAITYFADSDPCTGCRGQVATLSNAAGQVTTFNAYDADGRPTQITGVPRVAGGKIDSSTRRNP